MCPDEKLLELFERELHYYKSQKVGSERYLSYCAANVKQYERDIIHLKEKMKRNVS